MNTTDVNEWDPTQSIPLHPVLDGVHIRLHHVTTSKKLHSHDNRPPVSDVDWQNEVSAYGFEGFEGDANDHFAIEIQKDWTDRRDPKALKQLRTLRTRFRLRHLLTGCYLFSHKVKLPDWAFEQQEVSIASFPDNLSNLSHTTRLLVTKALVCQTVFGMLSQTSVCWLLLCYKVTRSWLTIVALSDPLSEYAVKRALAPIANTRSTVDHKAEKINYRKPGFIAKFLELQKVMWNTNAGLTDRHAYDSRPLSWPVLRRGIKYVLISPCATSGAYSASTVFGWKTIAKSISSATLSSGIYLHSPYLFLSLWEVFWSCELSAGSKISIIVSPVNRTLWQCWLINQSHCPVLYSTLRVFGHRLGASLLPILSNESTIVPTSLLSSFILCYLFALRHIWSCHSCLETENSHASSCSFHYHCYVVLYTLVPFGLRWEMDWIEMYASPASFNMGFFLVSLSYLSTDGRIDVYHCSGDFPEKVLTLLRLHTVITDMKTYSSATIAA